MASAPARAETALVEQLVARVDNPPFGLRAFSSRLRKNAGTDGSVHSTDSHLTDSTFAVGDRFVCPRVFPQPASLDGIVEKVGIRALPSREGIPALTLGAVRFALACPPAGGHRLTTQY